MRRSNKLLIIVRTCTTWDCVWHFCPATTTVWWSINSSFTTIELDCCIKYFWIHRGDGQSNFTNVGRWKTIIDFNPCFATINTLEQWCSRASTHVSSYVSMSLPTCEIKNIGVGWINDKISNTCPFVNGEFVHPIFTSISRFVQASFSSWAPQRALRRHPNGVWVIWMNNDFWDMFWFFQTHILPRRSTICTAINPMPDSNMTTTNIFSSTQPHNWWVVWVKSDATSWVKGLIISKWSPSCSGVCGFPGTPRTNCHVPNIFICRINCDICNTTRHKCRTYTTKRKPT